MKSGKSLTTGPVGLIGTISKAAESTTNGTSPPPDLAAGAAGLRILRGTEPESVAHPNPSKSALFQPDYDQRQDERPEEPHVEADQESCPQWLSDGATVRPRIAIGRVAAAQSAAIRAPEYCFTASYRSTFSS